MSLKTRGLISSVLCIAMLFVIVSTPSFADGASASAKNSIVFGSYPQTEIEATNEITAAQYDKNGDSVVNGIKYRRLRDEYGNFRYFIFEPILWEAIGEDIYLAKDILDCQPYDAQEKKYTDFLNSLIPYADDTTWETCTLHSWLNKDFCNTAFTENEKNFLIEIGIPTIDTALEIDSAILRKSCTGYATVSGVIDYMGAGKWFLQDTLANMGLASYVSNVDTDGKPRNNGILVNEDGIGIVPYLILSSNYQPEYKDVETETQIILYSPGGAAIPVYEKEVAAYIANGWYRNAEDAKKHLPQEMNNRFRSCSVFSKYEQYVTSYATEGDPQIEIEYNSMNATGIEIIDFVKPLIDANLTGNQNDYINIHFIFYYDATFSENSRDGFSLDQYSMFVLQPIIESYYTAWSGMVSPGCYSASGAYYRFCLNCRINGSNSYSTRNSAYFDKLREVAGAALAYSDRPLGQMQYIRNYFAENVLYQHQGSNTPLSVFLDGNGVCGSYANALSDLCYLLGIPCFEVTNTRQNHAWNRIFLENAWYDIDNTGITSADYSVNGVRRNYDPTGFNDFEARANNVSFLWVPYSNSVGLHSEPYDVDRETFSALMQIFGQSDLPVLYYATTDTDTIQGIVPSLFGAVSVTVDGKAVTWTDVVPFIDENDRTMVPLRAVADVMGLEVNWDAAAREAIFTNGGKTIFFPIDSITARTSDGAPVKMDTSAVIVNDRTYAPIRYLAEYFGYEIDWDAETQTVIITG